MSVEIGARVVVTGTADSRRGGALRGDSKKASKSGMAWVFRLNCSFASPLRTKFTQAMTSLTNSTTWISHPLSSNNDPPNAQERCSIIGEIDALDKQNEKLLQRLASIRTQLNGNAERLASLKWVVAPVRMVPLEVLGEIFLKMPTSSLRPGNYQKHITRLSLVCRNWRDAARITPRLWCDIWVKADAPRLSFETLSTWVTRGGNLQKTLEITSSTCGPMDRNTPRVLCGRKKCLFRNHALAKLLKHMPVEWNSVLLGCPTPHCLLRFIDSLREVGRSVEGNGWESLQSFKVVTTSWSGWVDRQDYGSRWKAFSFVPSSVTSFSLCLPAYPRNGEVVDPLLYDSLIEWHLQVPTSLLQRLTHLELQFDSRDISATTMFIALQYCVNLETLEIGLSLGEFTDDEENPVELPTDFNQNGLSFPKLHRLCLLQVVGESLEALQHMKFPNLAELFISFSPPGIRNTIDPGVDEVFMLEPTVEDSECDVRDLAKLIYGPDRHASPSCLQSLHLRGTCFLPGALHHVICDLDSLVHLKLEEISLLEGAQADFAMLINDEPAQLPSLRTLEVKNLRGLSENEVPHLRDFAEDRGIDLTLSFYDAELRRRDGRHYLAFVGLDDSDEEY